VDNITLLMCFFAVFDLSPSALNCNFLTFDVAEADACVRVLALRDIARRSL